MTKREGIAITDQLDWWDDGQMDDGIRPLVVALNAIPGVKTVSSCEGHGTKKANVMFLYDGMFPHIKRFFVAAEKAHACLGCYHLEIKYLNYYDCAHDLKQYWLIECDDGKDKVQILEAIRQEALTISKEK